VGCYCCCGNGIDGIRLWGSQASGAAPPAPPEYADKHMPDGYWNNPDILAQGKAIFTGQENIDVNC